MNLFAEMRVLVIAALDKMINAELLPAGIEFDNVAVEPPRDPLHGDMATNAAMVLAKPAGKKPREIADKLAALLLQDPRILILASLRWDLASGSMWNMSALTRLGRCMLAIPAGRCLAMLWPACWTMLAMR
jgi:hypothetical protein